MRRAVFLDRDGVINRAIVRDGRPHPPADAEALEILPGVIEAVRALKLAGFSIVIATNQPDVARGVTSRAAVDEIHRVITTQMPVDRIECCFHDGSEDCECRKPRPGMLLRAAVELDLDLANSFMVGDRWRDVDAGRQAGCKTIFIDYGYSEKRPDLPDHTVDSLPSATCIILAEQGINWRINEKN